MWLNQKSSDCYNAEKYEENFSRKHDKNKQLQFTLHVIVALPSNVHQHLSCLAFMTYFWYKPVENMVLKSQHASFPSQHNL